MHNTTASLSVSNICRLLLVILLLFSLTGCAALTSYFDFSDDEETNLQESAPALAAKGMEEYSLGRYFNAIEHFEKILSRYPFTPEAMLAELKAADCKYFMDKYQEALVLYKQFEERHPTNEAIPYVLFQKGMCSYQRIDRIDRDTSNATEAIQQFKQLLRLYPDSTYTPEARARIAAAQEFLANHEFFVAEYYLRQDKPKEAQGRLSYLLALYPDSAMAPQAKELLTQIEAGQMPSKDFRSFLPKIALPDWSIFSSDKKK